MRQQCAMAPQLNPRHHEEERRGLKGGASVDNDTQTPAVLLKHFYSEAWGQVVEDHAVCCPAQGRPEREAKGEGTDVGWARHPPLPAQSAQTPIRITRISSLTRALYGVSSSPAALHKRCCFSVHSRTTLP